ncbi:spermatogenesis-associated protein 22-like isoform X1 [Mizuhopecten yessoensis]|uniref:spermatogenesis-associated protein 22-like isoform X1 n=1 Tax=Mizuhopecten yessoensis TaxID=6573 RepID=UPI000B458803|nr:spermatogenesis-associated protein 22-like isoform X1 [Mizuhopecten yessoensis]
MKKNIPAPIFNHRKRPRQAVIADPQNIDGPGTSIPTNAQQSSHHYQAYNTNGPSPGRQLQTINKDLQGPNRGVTGGTQVSRTGSALPNSSRQLTGQSGQGWQADRQQRWSSGQASFTNKQVANTGNSQANHHQAPQSPPNIANNMSNSYGQQQNRYSKGNKNYNGQAGSQFMFQADNSGNTSSSRTNTYMNQKPFQTGTHRNQNSFRPGPGGAATVPETDNSREQFQPQGYQRVGSFGDSVSKPSTSSTQKEPKKATQKSENKADKSLHLITSTIQGMKHWSKYKDTINMIFEVYGVVDSAMMQDPSTTGKEFLVKDEQDSIPCVFYEIDRQLPRLTRGHWHRCVGSMDGRSGKLKCVSVRPASVEEKDVSKLSIKSSDTLLWDLTKTIPKP